MCVATIAWARDDDEERLLRRALESLASLGLPVAVADKGTRAGFAGFLERLPQFTVTAGRQDSLVAQAQASLREAAKNGRDYILYTESDKRQFFVEGLEPFVRAAPAADDVGIVVAARSARAFGTFPPVQRYTERVINELWERFGAEAGDYSYGPMLLKRELVPLLDGAGVDLGWGWRHFTFGATRRLGYRVVRVDGDYACPPDQRTEDERDRVHRARQLAQNVEGLVRGMTATLPE